MIDSYLVDDPTESDLYEPFEDIPGRIDADEHRPVRPDLDFTE